MDANRQVICPKCGHADAVRKVSSIVAEQTQSSEASGIGLAFGDNAPELMTFASTATSRSALAVKLAPPHKPLPPHGYGWAVVFGLGRLCLVLMVGFALIGAILTSFPFLVNTYSQNPFLVFVPTTAVIIFLIAAVGWLVRSSLRDIRARNQESGSYEAKLQKWTRAITQWNDSYYCARDDAIFIPRPAQRVSDAARSPLLRRH